MGVKVDWMDNVLDEIANRKEHLDLLQETKSLQKKLKQLDWEREEIILRLREIDVEMVHKNYGLHVVYNYE